MNNKIIGLLALCVIALTVVAFQLWNQESQPKEPTAAIVEPLDNSSKGLTKQPERVTVDTKSAQETSNNAESVVKNDEDTPTSDDYDPKLCAMAEQYTDWYPQGNGHGLNYESETLMQDIRAWASTRGYFETEFTQGSLEVKKRSDYDYYEIDALEDMAKAGDSMANVRLAYRLYLKGDKDSIERAQPYCDRAIADGYTALIMCKSSAIVREIYSERRKGDEEKDMDKLRRLELEYHAWEEVSTILGDKLGAKLSFNMLGDKAMDFDPEDIQQRASSMVNTIKQRRQQLGLGPIKHPEMPKLLEYMLKFDTDPSGALNACFE